MRSRAGLLAEKTREVRRIGERQVIRDLVDRLAGKHELALRLGEDALPDQVPGGDAGRALDVVVEPIRRHRELRSIKIKKAFFAEMLLDQLAQRLDGGVRGRERHASGPRAACG